MVPFFVQIKCQLGQSYDVANKLADAEIASEIYSTAGDFDLLVKFYVDPATDIGHFIAEKVQTISGVADTGKRRRYDPRTGADDPERSVAGDLDRRWIAGGASRNQAGRGHLGNRQGAGLRFDVGRGRAEAARPGR